MDSAYSQEQLSAYEEYISLPSRFRMLAKPELNIEYLTALHVHQISSVPYENLSLHYSTHHSVDLDPQVLYDKIVTDARGRGGYCMEASIFFNHVLKGLGFHVYTTGVRIRPRTDGVPSGNYTGWVHIVNIVTLPNSEKYMVDVGFGGDGATLPLPLIPDVVSPNLGTQELRLVWAAIPTQIDQSKKLWIYQYRNDPSKPWNSFYAFSEFEFFPADFEIMSYFTSTHMGRKNFQTKAVLIVRFLRKEEKIVGKVMLVNREVKRNLGGRTELVKVCEGEEERVVALKEFFGITLTDEEVSGIKGRIVEITSS